MMVVVVFAFFLLFDLLFVRLLLDRRTSLILFSFLVLWPGAVAADVVRFFLALLALAVSLLPRLLFRFLLFFHLLLLVLAGDRLFSFPAVLQKYVFSGALPGRCFASDFDFGMSSIFFFASPLLT